MPDKTHTEKITDWLYAHPHVAFVIARSTVAGLLVRPDGMVLEADDDYGSSTDLVNHLDRVIGQSPMRSMLNRLQRETTRKREKDERAQG